MDRKTDRLYILHIRDAIKLIESWSVGRTLEDFQKDEKLQSAIIRQFEIIGEATKHISDQQKVITPEIPWQPIADTRNTLIHGYFKVDEKKVWDMIQIDLPELKKHIELLIGTLEKE